ncbi:hypothetical protein Corgl_0443 [Coriobacterium glomerans PW2]|uniref:SGNH/GDSL hydrolase family protein n=1 Tax=Coriobacterium glomerans (strain ATCC 49209 / DSM 20642 / JCM 10262 / PW2) TaxID=700015 RepID=F2N786_CORGP|nr:hypothetical protein [Coriobacterium glomerans]AEB06561.1 hypothetical protein Corgl_0443 [Coriobacterium glomerans PW2]
MVDLRFRARGARAALALVVALAGGAGVLSAASYIVEPKNNQAEFGMIEARANGVLGEPDDSIDAVFIGDSEVFSAVSPLQMWGERGFTSYACSTTAQQLCYTRTLLLRALARQHPRVVVLESDCFFYPFTAADGLKREIQDVFPVFEYHDRWKSLGPQDLLGPLRHTWTDDLKGFRLNASIKPVDALADMNRVRSDAELPWINRLYIADIARICRDHGSELVIATVPSMKNMNDARHARIQQIADELHVDYIDLNDEKHDTGVDWSHDTRDFGDHVNIFGAKKVSASLGEILSSRYNLPDHRGDPAYRGWETALARYDRRVDRLIAEAGADSQRP